MKLADFDKVKDLVGLHRALLEWRGFPDAQSGDVQDVSLSILGWDLEKHGADFEGSLDVPVSYYHLMLDAAIARVLADLEGFGVDTGQPQLQVDTEAYRKPIEPSSKPDDVVALLTERGPLPRREIMAALGLSVDAVKHRLRRLRGAGRIVTGGDGIYAIAPDEAPAVEIAPAEAVPVEVAPAPEVVEPVAGLLAPPMVEELTDASCPDEPGADEPDMDAVAQLAAEMESAVDEAPAEPLPDDAAPSVFEDFGSPPSFHPPSRKARVETPEERRMIEEAIAAGNVTRLPMDATEMDILDTLRQAGHDARCDRFGSGDWMLNGKPVTFAKIIAACNVIRTNQGLPEIPIKAALAIRDAAQAANRQKKLNAPRVRA